MENPIFEKSKVFILSGIIDYVPNSVVKKTIVNKITGNITIASFDGDETLREKATPFDTFIQLIDGKAEIVIDDHINMLEAGQFIIIPAHSHNTIKAIVRFKMISVIIKSGYESVS